MNRNIHSGWRISVYRVGLVLLLLVAGLPVAEAQNPLLDP
jgi:hypothetical protein